MQNKANIDSLDGVIKAARLEKLRLLLSQCDEKEVTALTATLQALVVKKIVLRNLREVIAYGSQYEAEFIREAFNVSMREQDGQKAMVEATRRELKELERSRVNVKTRQFFPRLVEIKVNKLKADICF